jgi:hypothetical protein
MGATSMIRFIIKLSAGLLPVATASAQVTCTRTGDQVYCNGTLQQPRPSVPRVYSDPYGSYQSGYEAGVIEGRARNLAKATQQYLNGEINPRDNERFLQYIAKYGGDVVWFRNDMAIKEQQQRSIDSPSSASAASIEPKSVAVRLKELDALLESGAISQSEHDAKRKEILDSL